MIREIYVVTTRFDKVKCVCESKDEADILAAIADEDAKVETVPFFPAYGYMKLTTRGVENE